MVPVDNPRFSMVVVVSEPDPSRRGYYGGSVSGPVFHDVMQGALRLMDVPPDDIGTWIAAQEQEQGPGTRGRAVAPAIAATASAGAGASQ